MPLDYDQIDQWGPLLSEALRPFVPASFPDHEGPREPDYVEDARDLLLDACGRGQVTVAATDWIRSNDVAAYHGTRLTEAELSTVLADGLEPLRGEARRERLDRALRRHPDWAEMEPRLDAAIEAYAQGRAGQREGQVHLTISKSGLTEGFPQYLKAGSDFDRHVAHSLLGPEGIRLLERDGDATVLRLSVPGHDALQAANLFVPVEERIRAGEMPHLVEQFLSAWAFRLFHPQFQSASLTTDCGLMFREAVPAAWIVDHERWAPPPSMSRDDP